MITESLGFAKLTQVSVAAIGKLQDAVRDRTARGSLFDDVHFMLEALPLSSSQFAAATRHLQNASSYCRRHEYGAALYELRLLQRGLGTPDAPRRVSAAPGT